MARIRSISPEQWTDDQFVAMSPLARLLALAIRNDCDDNGTFDLNPRKLKMRLLPGDNCDMDALIAELVENRQIIKYEIDGKSYGMVRNFTEFQRPKKPTFWNPVPNQFPTGYELNPSYSAASSPLVGNRFPTRVEPPPTASPLPPPVTVTVAVEVEVEESKSGASAPGAPAQPSDDEPDDLSPIAALDRSPEGIAVRAWNAVAGRVGLAQVQRLTDTRRAKLRKRLDECGGLDGWSAALAKVEGSPFLLGKIPGRDWRADFDFLLQQKSFTKLMEGVYDRPNPPDPSAAEAADRRAIVEGLGLAGDVAAE